MYSFFRLLLLVTVIFLLTTFFVFDRDLFLGNKNKSVSTPQTTQKAQSLKMQEVIRGNVLALENDILTVKRETGGEVKIKLLPGVLVLKQIRLTPHSTGSEPSHVNKGDTVSVTAAKNSQGELETLSVVILDANLDKIVR